MARGDAKIPSSLTKLKYKYRETDLEGANTKLTMAYTSASLESAWSV
jgi:hypothetical protein